MDDGDEHPTMNCRSKARTGSTTGAPPGPVAAATCHSFVGRRPEARGSGRLSTDQNGDKTAVIHHPRLATNIYNF